MEGRGPHAHSRVTVVLAVRSLVGVVVVRTILLCDQ